VGIVISKKISIYVCEKYPLKIYMSVDDQNQVNQIIRTKIQALFSFSKSTLQSVARYTSSWVEKKNAMLRAKGIREPANAPKVDVNGLLAVKVGALKKAF
jgi:hypothetical protein